MAATSFADHAVCVQRCESEVYGRIRARFRAIGACGGSLSGFSKKRTREEIETSIHAHLPQKGKPDCEATLLFQEIISTNALGSFESQTPSHHREDSSSKDSDIPVPKRQRVAISEAHKTPDAWYSAFRNYVTNRLPISRYDEMFSMEISTLFDSGTNHAFEAAMEFDAARKRHIETLAELQNTKLQLKALEEDLKVEKLEKAKLEIKIKEIRAYFKENNGELLDELENMRAKRDKEREDRVMAESILNALKSTHVGKVCKDSMKQVNELRPS